MPLSFDSISHGSLAFGFFNIESDMLLCDRYFLFASDFCNYVGDIAECHHVQPYTAKWRIQFIEASDDIGDLMSAIHGVRFTGFIGELYRRFPFPQEAEDFKQNPEGFQTQNIVSDIITNFAKPILVPVEITDKNQEIRIGTYRFKRTQFQELIKYVWRGGYPRWKDEIRPSYAIEMKNKIMQNCKGLLHNMDLED